MKTVTIPCEVGEIIYYPRRTAPIPAHLKVTQIRITQPGIIVDATNGRAGEEFHFTENDFGKKVFTVNEEAKAFTLAEKMYSK